jgi:glycosyltransferase involved in cell wall biosynthesis
MRRRVLMGLQFFPRGGSAHVANNLARALPQHGWDVSVVSGSLSIPGRPGDASEFYRGLDVHPVDMTGALDALDPLRADPPLHPSYEARDDAPDRPFYEVDDDTFEHHVDVWSRELAAAGAAEADVLHLHHLTPLNEAAARVAPDVPVVGHLHGTELAMLEELDSDHPWAERLRGWAQACERLIVLSDNQVQHVEDLLDVDRDRCIRVPNGFDPELFEPRATDRSAFWRRHLGLDPGEPVLLFVGRFTKVKRIPLLIEAFAQARPDAALVIVGGFPGEFEGEHPERAIERLGADRVHLAGWHGHDELPGFFAASDAVVLPSVREQFGQVLVEGMACGLPAIAVDAHGPAEIVRHGETGWLVEPDDVDDLAHAIAEAVADPQERRRRGAAACEDARERYAWPALAGEVAELYEQVALLTRSR